MRSSVRWGSKGRTEASLPLPLCRHRVALTPCPLHHPAPSLQVGASGRVPVVEVDHVEDARALRAAGFDATYLFIGMDDNGKLLNVIQQVGRQGRWARVQGPGFRGKGGMHGRRPLQYGREQPHERLCAHASCCLPCILPVRTHVRLGCAGPEGRGNLLQLGHAPRLSVCVLFLKSACVCAQALPHALLLLIMCVCLQPAWSCCPPAPPCNLARTGAVLQPAPGLRAAGRSQPVLWHGQGRGGGQQGGGAVRPVGAAGEARGESGRHGIPTHNARTQCTCCTHGQPTSAHATSPLTPLSSRRACPPPPPHTNTNSLPTPTLTTTVHACPPC